MKRVHVDIKGLALPQELMTIDQALVALGAECDDDVSPPHYQFEHDDPAALRAQVRQAVGEEIYQKLAWETDSAD
ncbi:MAG: hypothetical protein AB7S26_30650 [Sandaracinaceae bacterium]